MICSAKCGVQAKIVLDQYCSWVFCPGLGDCFWYPLWCTSLYELHISVNCVVWIRYVLNDCESVRIIILLENWKSYLNRYLGRNHPTITDAQQGLMVLDRFRSQFEAPTSLEGYDRIMTLTASDFPSPQHTLVETSAIIERLRLSVPESTSIISRNFRTRGGWRRAGHRAATHSSRGKSSLSSDSQQSTTQGGGRRYTKGRGGFSSESRDYDWRGNRTLPWIH